MKIDWHSKSIYILEMALYYLGLIFYVIAGLLYIKVAFSIPPLISLIMSGSFLGFGIFIVWLGIKIDKDMDE